MENKRKLSYDPSTGDVYKRDLGRVATLWKGDWNPDERYEEMDEVRHSGVKWICLEDCMNMEPGTNPAIWAPQLYDGAQGEQGVQGVQGNNGVQGIQGLKGEDASMVGPQGADGPQGIQGPKGDTGEQGNPGIQGNNGIQGPDGPQGIQGNQGVQGNPGIQGYTGADGQPGPRGLTGPRGQEGPEGAQGQRGAQGYKGDTGNKGETGAQGKEGAMGSQGSTGSQGSQGSTGEVGPQGETGIQGATGTQGYGGLQGVQGDNGGHPIILTQAEYDALTQKDPTAIYIISDSQAPQGVTGSQGADGIQGYTGAQGETGIQGATGSTGETGAQGTTGETGAQGETGTQGFNGIQGVDGLQGIQGIVGSQGVQGATGPAGESVVDENAPNVIIIESDVNTNFRTTQGTFEGIYRNGVYSEVIGNTIAISKGHNVITMEKNSSDIYNIGNFSLDNYAGHYWIYFSMASVSGTCVDYDQNNSYTDCNLVIYTASTTVNGGTANKVWYVNNEGVIDANYTGESVLFDKAFNITFSNLSTGEEFIPISGYVNIPYHRVEELKTYMENTLQLQYGSMYIVRNTHVYDRMTEVDGKFNLVYITNEDKRNTLVMYNPTAVYARVWDSDWVGDSCIKWNSRGDEKEERSNGGVSLYPGKNVIEWDWYFPGAINLFSNDVWVWFPYNPHWNSATSMGDLDGHECNVVITTTGNMTVNANGYTNGQLVIWNTTNHSVMNMMHQDANTKAKIVFFDAPFDNFEITYYSEDPQTDIDATLYVPKSRYTEFVTRIQTLYPNANITYFTNKIVQYDFVVQSGYTFKMITLPSNP